MILLPTYLTYLTYYNPPLLESSASSSSSSSASAHMPGRGKREGQYMDTYGDCCCDPWMVGGQGRGRPRVKRYVNTIRVTDIIGLI